MSNLGRQSQVAEDSPGPRCRARPHPSASPKPRLWSRQSASSSPALPACPPF